ncbi:MAG: hypothetical protein ACKO37_00995 [Vampirovibrionales bacterium]
MPYASWVQGDIKPQSPLKRGLRGKEHAQGLAPWGLLAYLAGIGTKLVAGLHKVPRFLSFKEESVA